MHDGYSGGLADAKATHHLKNPPSEHPSIPNSHTCLAPVMYRSRISALMSAADICTGKSTSQRVVVNVSDAVMWVIFDREVNVEGGTVCMLYADSALRQAALSCYTASIQTQWTQYALTRGRSGHANLEGLYAAVNGGIS